MVIGRCFELLVGDGPVGVTRISGSLGVGCGTVIVSGGRCGRGVRNMEYDDDDVKPGETAVESVGPDDNGVKRSVHGLNSKARFGGGGRGKGDTLPFSLSFIWILRRRTP
jgi:hypothetical protein